MIASSLLFLVSLGQSGGSSATAADLRCEYLVNPSNVGEAIPRLSWVDQALARGWTQRAYQVRVASSEALLKSGLPDAWDSGKVASAESTQIEYHGKPLRSATRYFWQVRVWDASGTVSRWSPAQWWETGLFKDSDWGNSQWIGQPGPAGENPAPYLRKEFTVNGKIKRARIYAAGIGYADIHLNGNLVAATERDPGYTNFNKRILYVSYDVTQNLKPGANALGAILGTGWYDVHDVATWHFERAPWRGRPRLRLLLAIDYQDGRRELAPSDATWRVTDGPIRTDGIYTGELYDARREMPGWDRPGFASQNWKSASLMEAPKGVLAARRCPPVATGEVITPKVVTEPVPGIYVVDFGQNFAGHVRLKVKSRPGQKITMRYSERLDRDGMIQRSEIDTFMAKQTPPQPFQTDTYICKGGGVETFEQRFSYSGFRFVEMRGVPHAPDADMVQGVFAHTDLKSAGRFSSSDSTINKIQCATLYSYLSNAQSIVTDCPQREKNGWTGDAQLACEAGLMNFQSPTLYTKWLDDLADDQDANGLVSLIVPSNGWGHGSFNPAWDSAYLIVADDLYRYCADRRVLSNHFDHLARYVDALYRETKDGVIPFDSLGDWLPWSTVTPSQFSSTIYLHEDAKILAKAATVLGKKDLAKKYEDMANTVYEAFNKAYYDAPNQGYSNNSQTANSMALFFNMVPKASRAGVFSSLVKNVETQGHIDTGILGAKYILRVLSQGGRTDLAYKLVTRKEVPSWAAWIGQGATTLWEDWKGESSLNHIMFGDVSNWFYQWIAGIAIDPASPGFSHFEIHPQVVGDLTWASATYDSPHGPIVSAWKTDALGFHLDVTVPANTTATITVPTAGMALTRIPCGASSIA